MENMTLREMCDAVNVSRRAVQGYEKAELVSASGKNERGYLLYDINSRERIKRIKFFQELGFTLREIKDIIDAPNCVLKAALKERIDEIKKEGEHMEVLIGKANELMERL